MEWFCLYLKKWNAEMLPMNNPRFELRKVTETEWVILDLLYGQNDTRRTVACVSEGSGAGVEVTWLQGFALRTTYSSVAGVFEEVVKLRTRPRSQRPIHIPTPHSAPNV